MTTLCAEVSRVDAHRAIVFDSSPLLMSPEAPILASEVGQVVLVVRANRTPPKSVLQARDRLDPKKAISVVLNQADWADKFGLSDYQPYGA
jgi:hypothetical protein